MATELSAVGTILVAIATLLLYAFRDPAFGNGLMLESHNPRREKIGARGGLALMLCGIGLQVAAIVTAD